MASYEKLEREVVLQSDDEGNVWNAFVLRQKVINKFLKAGFVPDKIVDGAYYFTNIPYNCISIKKPSTRVMSEAQRIAASERFKKMHLEKKEKD